MIKLPYLLFSTVLVLSYLSSCAKAGSNKHVADIVIDGSTGVKPLVEALVAGYLDQSKKNQYKNKIAEFGITIGSGLNPKHRIQELLYPSHLKILAFSG